MMDVVNHASGVVFSVRTFRPLWVFPWHSSVWRQFPMRNCLAVYKYPDKATSEIGHRELTKLLAELDFGEKLGEVARALEQYAKSNEDGKVASYRLVESVEEASKMRVRITPEQAD